MDLWLSIDGHAVWLPAVALLGLAVGVVAGMFGVGGGSLMVPLLSSILGVPLPFAVGVGQFQTIATGVGAFLRYRRAGLAEVRFDFLLVGGGAVGVYAGGRLLHALARLGTVDVGGRQMSALSLALTAIYIVLFVSIAAMLWWKYSAESEEHPPEPGPLARLRLPPYLDLPTARLSLVSGPLVAYIGMLAGSLGALLGIGGGILLLPIMLYGYGFRIRSAAGTGIAATVALSSLATAQSALGGHIHLGLALTATIGAGLAAQVGAGLTRKLPGRLLRRGLAVVMLSTVATMVVRLIVG
jgi:uncharacterized protein